MTDEEREDLNTFRHDLVKQARWWQWKAETLEKEKEQLKSENASLRERLEKAVNKRVVANMLAKYFDCPCNFSPIDEEMFDFCNECCNDNVICWEKFIEKNNAEARLEELKGGEK